MKPMGVRYLLVGLLATAGDRMLPPGLVRETLYCAVAAVAAVGAAGAAAIVVGVHRNRPAHPLAWYLIAAGILSWVVGSGQHAVLGHTLPVGAVPPIADAFYFATYPLVAAGLLMLDLDRSLILPMADDARAAALVASTIALAHSLELRTASSCAWSPRASRPTSCWLSSDGWAATRPGATSCRGRCPLRPDRRGRDRAGRARAPPTPPA